MVFALELKVHKEVAKKHAKGNQFYGKILDNRQRFLYASANLICKSAQNMPEFLDMVASSLQRDKNDPWAVHIIAAPTPSTALTE